MLQAPRIKHSNPTFSLAGRQRPQLLRSAMLLCLGLDPDPAPFARDIARGLCDSLQLTARQPCCILYSTGRAVYYMLPAMLMTCTAWLPSLTEAPMMMPEI